MGKVELFTFSCETHRKLKEKATLIFLLKKKFMGKNMCWTHSKNRKLGISKKGRALANLWQTSLTEQGLHIFPHSSVL